jgi:Lar family restriction alleviation protein
MDKLKGCPFCGGEARRFYCGETTFFACNNCHANLYLKDTEELTIAAWNTRPTETALQETLKTIYKATEGWAQKDIKSQTEIMIKITNMINETLEKHGMKQ